MGYSKKLYNVLGGVTSIIIACPPNFCQSQISQILQNSWFDFINFAQQSIVTNYQINSNVFCNIYQITL